MKYKKYIIILALLIIVGFVLYFVQKAKHKKTAQSAQMPIEERKISYSRITFFNASIHRASLAIPSYWEGNYRIREEGDTVLFLDIGNPSAPKELFWISHKDLADWEKSQSKQGWQEIGRVEKTVFLFKLSTAKKEDSPDFTMRLSEAKDFMKSFIAN
jgi:hypothetical protein